MRTTSTHWRFGILALIFMGIGTLILLQSLRHQVFSINSQVSAAAVENGPAIRGSVVDSSGVPLIVNRHYYQLAASPDLIGNDKNRREVAQQLDSLFGIPEEETFAILSETQELRFSVLADAITLEQANLLHEYTQRLEAERGVFPLQHVYAKPMTRRSYPQAELMAHLTGFVTVDSGGVTGVEGYYDEFLPADGIGLLNNDTQPLDVLPAEVRRYLPSPAGKDLVLTVDRTVQWIIYEELIRGLELYRAVSGSVIVMEPQTGAILGMVNLPDFDPNRFEIAPIELFNNPIVSAQYEPGSIFKIITIGAALDAGIVEPSTIFTDSGTITVGDRVIFNSDRTAHGNVTTTEALARSLNVVTAQIAQSLGSEKFYRYVRQFGFGEAANVDLSGEIEGILKSPGSPLWSPSDLGTNSFGQGLAVTPLQMVNAAAAIANHGRMMQPHVVHARVVGDRVQLTDPTAVRQVLTPEAADTLAEMMTEVVETGSNKAAVPGYRVAGKSGTAQIPSPDGYEEDATIVSFVGFAPAENPRFVVLVKMDRPDPNINQWASHTAAPVFSRITKRLLDYYNIPPEKEKDDSEPIAGE